MNFLFTIALIILGLVAGVFSGLVGVGGGVIIVPALVYLFGLTQQTAQGTTLALLVPPIGLLAAYTYYKQGFVDLRIAVIIAIGFIIGGFLGSKFAVKLPTETLTKIFAVSIILIGFKMLLGR